MEPSSEVLETEKREAETQEEGTSAKEAYKAALQETSNPVLENPQSKGGSIHG